MSCANWYIKHILVTRYIAFKLIETSCRFPNLFRFILFYFISIFVAGLFWLSHAIVFLTMEDHLVSAKGKKKGENKRKKENITTVLEKLLTIAKLSILFI